MGYSWQVALGAVFISGVIFVGLSVSRVREWIINSIPSSLRYAMTAGVGLFLGIIGLKSAGIVVGSPATLVTLGDFTQPQAILAAVCFFIISVLSVKQVFGAVLIGIFSVTLIGLGLGLFEYQAFSLRHLVLPPPFSHGYRRRDECRHDQHHPGLPVCEHV